jgi:rsbT co-antagonist protein RsbR
VHLLGAQAIITGLRPAIAQTMASLGLDFSQVITMRDLQEALRHCITLEGKARTPR